MNEQTCLPSAARLLSSACAQCTLALMITLSSDLTGRYYPFMLIPYALILFVADRIFLRRERTMMALVLLNGGICLAAFISLLPLGGIRDWSTAVIAGVFCVWLAVDAGQLSQKKPTLSQLILGADLCLVLLVVFTAYLTAMELPVFWCVPIAAGCAASILGIMAFRSGTGLGPRSWVFLTGVFAGVFGMVWLLVSFVAAPAGEGLVTLWNWLTRAILFVLNGLWQFLLFLLSLLPDGQYEELPVPPVQQFPEQMEELFQANPLAKLLFLSALGIGAVVAGVIVLRYLHRLRLPAIRTRPGSTVRRGRISLLSALRRLLMSGIRAVRFQLWLWKNRNTAQGLYFLLVGRSSRTPWHKRSGETPREFLSRLEQQTAGNRELTQAFEQLIPAVERALFAPGARNVPVPQARFIRCRLGGAIRQELMKNILTRLRSRLGHLRTTSSCL